ncbi:MAG TPA: tyrosine decarboxylase MfnA [Candidatus Thermoplasmatota archaeon]|nr:tyrosine decarboxylase MfnA [Candidatus Thermoplasmatota archaeon]
MEPPRREGLPEKGLPDEEVRRRLAAARLRDARFDTGRILGSMCTLPHPLAREAHATFAEANLGDPAMCPGSAQIEALAADWILTLLSAPPGAGAEFVSGGSEANILALLVHRKPGRDEVVLPRSAHFSFEKAARLLGLRLRKADLNDDYTVDVADVERLVGPRTACLVGIAGATETGSVDDVPALSEVAAAQGVPLHVDAAFGGFVIPFAKRLGHRLPDFDFALPGVSTVTIDPHKMGRAGIPCGVLAARDASLLRGARVETPYLSAEGHFTLVGTRSAAGPASAYAAMASLGEWGYVETVRECLAVTDHLVRSVSAIGVPLAAPPTLNLVALRVPSPRAVREALSRRGWIVNLAPLAGGIRIVLMPHVTREAVDAFVPDLAAAIQEVSA